MSGSFAECTPTPLPAKRLGQATRRQSSSVAFGAFALQQVPRVPSVAVVLSCVGADATFECVATATLSLKQLGKDLRRDGAALSFHKEERVSAMLQHEPSYYLQLVEERILFPGEWTR
jgi:hypothetical protein